MPENKLGCQNLMPFLPMADLDKAYDFYTSVLQLEGKLMRDEAGTALHGEFSRDGNVLFMIGYQDANYFKDASEGVSGSVANFYLYVDDVDKTFDAAIKADGEAVQHPEDQMWGDRCALFIDPFGYRWMLAKRL